jgi:hypothetical protein
MPPIRRALLWLALASPISKLTLFCLNLVLWHWVRRRKPLATRTL